MDGVKKLPYKPGEIWEIALEASHVEVQGSLSKTITNNIEDILRGKSFKRCMMTGDIRLVQQYNLNEGFHDKDIKNKRFIMIQGQFQEQLSFEEVIELEEINSKMI